MNARVESVFPDATPEQKARVARRTMIMATRVLIYVARDNGVTDDRLKGIILALRSPELSALSDDEALGLIQEFKLAEA